ncbi:flavin-containing monooxygenase FMO, partial [Burkholderia sp. TJI49]
TWRFRQATAHFSIADYHAYRAPRHDPAAQPLAAPAASASAEAA